MIIYQLLPRLWGNTDGKNVPNGSIADNHTGKFSSIDSKSLDYIKWLGCSHVWFTGVIRHATITAEQGCIPSHPQFVKGNAGSPYAIVDYYDVNPYLADDPSRRIEEYQDLIRRTHEAGLKVIMDFVPNHVSRDYGKVSPTPGHPILGAQDDKNVHWKHENDFFYYPGQSLTLPRQAPEGTQPYQEYPAMATGNNFSPSPNINDWYETIKINYCEAYSPTWEKMLDIVKYWAKMGVDGFRCDMVELVPPTFMKWLITQAKAANPELIFIAEVYKKDGYYKYIREVGFDYLYDKSGLYDTLRQIVEKNAYDNFIPVQPWQSTESITRNWQDLGDLQPYMLNFLENHDEQRFASDFFGGEANKAYAALCVSLMMNRAPFMLYFGQEVGERGMDAEGFSDRNGRTTIFDWWSPQGVKKLSALIESGLYKDIDKATGTILSEEEAVVFKKYSQSLQFASTNEAISKGQFYDLCYCNYGAEGFDPKRHFAFLRYHGGQTLLFVANFSEWDAKMQLTIPQHAFEWMELPVTKNLGPDTLIRIDVPAYDYVMFKLS